MNSSNPTQKLLKDIGFTLLSEGKTIKVRAEGYSMYPSIRPGSLIYIEPLNKGENPKVGEIIAWKRESGLVVHRLSAIIGKGNGIMLVTRGDSSPSEDQPILPDTVAGRVVRIENASGIEISPGVYSKRRNTWWFNRLNLKIRLYSAKFMRMFGRLASAR